MLQHIGTLAKFLFVGALGAAGAAWLDANRPQWSKTFGAVTFQPGALFGIGALALGFAGLPLFGVVGVGAALGSAYAYSSSRFLVAAPSAPTTAPTQAPAVVSGIPGPGGLQLPGFAYDNSEILASLRAA
jgi:hypothetical protein